MFKKLHFFESKASLRPHKKNTDKVRKPYQHHVRCFHSDISSTSCEKQNSFTDSRLTDFTNGHPNVSLCQCWTVVDSIANHRHLVTFRLKPLHFCHFVTRKNLRERDLIEIVLFAAMLPRHTPWRFRLALLLHLLFSCYLLKEKKCKNIVIILLRHTCK